MSYQALAGVYDGFFESDYQRKILDRYRRILSGLGVLQGDIIDLGCGTGRLSIPLCQGGAHVCGVEPDEAMLDCAMEKGKGLPIQWHHGVLPQLEGFDCWDAVTASLDVINHILRENELLDTFCAAKRLLRKGGVLVFDVNTEKKFREIYGQNTYVFRSPGAFAAWENDYDAKAQICHFTVNVFTRQGALYQRQTDHIQERYYSPQRLSWLLKKAGFRHIRILGMDQGTRHVYIVK